MPSPPNYSDSDYQHVLWDTQGRPYWAGPSGKPIYINPLTAAQYANPSSPTYDPKLAAWAKSMGAQIDYSQGTGPGQEKVISSGAPNSGFATAQSSWNGDTGQWDRGSFFNTPLGGLLIGGGTMAAGAGLGAAGVGAPTASTAGSTLASMVPASTGLAEAAPETALLGGTAGAAVPASTLASTSVLPSTTIGTGMMAGLPTVSPLASTGSTISRALGSLGNLAPNLASSLGSLQQGIQNNRLQTGALAAQYDSAQQAAQTGRNQTETDALKKLAETNYILSGGFKPGAQSIQLNGQTRVIPQLGMAPLAPSAAQKAGAQSLQDQLGARLAPGGTATPLPFSSYGVPGTGENLASAGSALTSLIPTVKSIYNLFNS